MPCFAPRTLAHRRHRPWPTPCLAPRGTSRAARLPVALDTAWLPRVATPRQMLSLPSHKWNSQCATQLAAPLSRFCMPRCTGFVPPLHGSARTHSVQVGGAVCMAMPTTGEHCNIPDNGPLPASGSRFTASTMSESAMVHHSESTPLRRSPAPHVHRSAVSAYTAIVATNDLGLPSSVARSTFLRNLSVAIVPSVHCVVERCRYSMVCCGVRKAIWHSRPPRREARSQRQTTPGAAMSAVQC